MAAQHSLINRTALLIASIVFLILATCGLCLSFLLPVPFIEHDYGLMVDAGSTKSEIKIYKWPHREDNSIPLVELAPDCENPYSLRVEPGISSFVGRLEDLEREMIVLMEYALEHVPENQYPYTPLYLKATAGMRLLPIQDQEDILATIRNVFRQYPFMFEDPWVEVISGQDEGVFGYLTVNHLKKTLTQNDPLGTFGALDLGGASTQITFVPQEYPTSDNYTMEVGGTEYNLFSKSYLSYGSDEARYSYNESLIDASPYIPNPCLQIGFDLDSATFELEGETYYLNGTGSYDQCEQTISENLFDESLFPPPTSPLRGLFYAFAGFFYTPQFFNLPADTTIEMIKQKGIEFCNLTWEEVKQNYPGVDPRYLANYCFNTAYIVNLLTVYGFDPQSSDVITFAGSIDCVNLDWTMGAILFEADKIVFEEEPTTILFKTFFGIVTITISVFFLLLGLLFFLFYRRTQKRNEETTRLLEAEL